MSEHSQQFHNPIVTTSGSQVSESERMKEEKKKTLLMYTKYILCQVYLSVGKK